MAITGTANMSATERLNIVKAAVDCGRTELARAEANLENLEKQQAGIEAELSELGVKPEDLDATIADLRAEVDRLLGEAEKLLAEPQAEEKGVNGGADQHAA